MAINSLIVVEVDKGFSDVMTALSHTPTHSPALHSVIYLTVYLSSDNVYLHDLYNMYNIIQYHKL